MSMFTDVHEFHQKFELPCRKPGETFQRDIVLFRLSFLLEELQELSSALNNDNIEEATDALVDLIYVAAGTGEILSLPLKSAWNEVHKANMKKIKISSSKESKRGSIIDIAKPSGWKPPDIFKYLDAKDRKMRLKMLKGL